MKNDALGKQFGAIGNLLAELLKAVFAEKLLPLAPLGKGHLGYLGAVIRK